MRSKRIEAFTDRYPLVGPAFWIASVQYYLVQLVAAHAWEAPFSLSTNLISDLGNTTCGQYSGRIVCSPLHALMNASFLILGITMIVGSILIYHEFRESRAAAAGFGFMAIAGFGTLLVGLFPENTNVVVHTVGATLAFLVGNLSMLVLARTLVMPQALRLYTIASGIVGLGALAVALTHVVTALGVGGIERAVAFPQSIWLIVFGIYMSRNRFVNGYGYGTK